MNWKLAHWENVLTVQIRVIGNQSKTTIAILQEELLNGVKRTEVKAYWSEIIKKIEIELLG
ncbi:hypothetical protein KO529_13745 [Arenibacter algicola]|uniref:hypothetical protein n=1 Tax=Arenibacter algicola TaxID=616991 RepID=UPI001C0708F0|nr:hypothetical protein [Arenibacter algicola]MBU2905857.1 hypothetical protein [Arenibacter algicola]